jgi:hypothetical protein
MAYKDMFNESQYPEGVVAKTKELMGIIWKKKSATLRQRVEAMQSFATAVSALYQVAVPEIIYIPNAKELYNQTGGGIYTPDSSDGNGIIFLYDKMSFTTFLHEYRHHLQHKLADLPHISIDMYDNLNNAASPEAQAQIGRAIEQAAINSEEDARGWSCSLYFIADPEKYQNAVDKGLLHFE